MSKDDVRGHYQKFLSSPAGKDFLEQTTLLETNHIVNGIKANEADKAAHFNKLEGMYGLRDYVLRLGSSTGAGNRSPGPNPVAKKSK